MALPRLVSVRQKFEEHKLADIPGAVRKELTAAHFGAQLKPGARIAIGTGSRGIANLAAIMRAAVDYWKSLGMCPFLFPAMGSHGAATAEGQADVLAHYGITEAAMGCPIVSSLEVVALGKTPEGIDTFIDRAAYESDGVMLVNRVKWHTDFEGKLESGIFKMLAIGIGKLAGAQNYHTQAYRLGLEAVIRSAGRRVLGCGKILGGLAILEDASHHTAQVSAVPVESLERREEELLALVKSWRGRIPVDLDLLIVDEIGKNISGAGMDTKVVNRDVAAHYNPFPGLPRIERIFVRDLTDLACGNGEGIGLADVIADRVLRKIDWKPTYVNSLTSSTPAVSRVPLHFPTDRECLDSILPTVGKFEASDVTVGWIRNTMELGRLALSENLLPQIRENPALEVEGPPYEFEFDAQGDLMSPVAEHAGAGAA